MWCVHLYMREPCRHLLGAGPHHQERLGEEAHWPVWLEKLCERRVGVLHGKVARCLMAAPSPLTERASGDLLVVCLGARLSVLHYEFMRGPVCLSN